MDIINGRKNPKSTAQDGALETHLDKKKKEIVYKRSGFQKTFIRGKSETDDLFEERMKAHKDEIEKFYKTHPEAKRIRNKKGKFQ